MMPAWKGRLDDNTLRQLTVYLHQLGGGEAETDTIEEIQNDTAMAVEEVEDTMQTVTETDEDVGVSKIEKQAGEPELSEE